MLSLSDVTGQDVRVPGGRVVGRVADLSTRLGVETGPYLVDRILVRGRHGPGLLVPWEEIESFAPDGVVLRRSGAATRIGGASTVNALDAEEILLVRDVLDTQIVDVAGCRLARVADVVLTRSAADRLELVGVDVGFGAVLHRLGLRRWASHARRDVVAWTDLHLTSERGHSVQLATPRSAVHHLDADQLAVLVSALDVESATEVLAASAPSAAAEAVRAAPVSGERVLRALPRNEVERIVAAMPAEHASRWRVRISRPPGLQGRRFLRFRVWPRRRHRLGIRGARGGGGNR